MLTLHIFKVISPTIYSQYLFMYTYYLAQRPIALGDIRALENKDDFSEKSSFRKVMEAVLKHFLSGIINCFVFSSEM